MTRDTSLTRLSLMSHLGSALLSRWTAGRGENLPSARPCARADSESAQRTFFSSDASRSTDNGGLVSPGGKRGGKRCSLFAFCMHVAMVPHSLPFDHFRGPPGAVFKRTSTEPRRTSCEPSSSVSFNSADTLAEEVMKGIDWS
ncbi:hypothetical protein SKAU_G00037210 [Synaphobranchus kaupii]|uniref:Uncharacterized protein n=1 Tax=Synaphobranchus kaupii TaxID=118154 RepID=A0A9Q1GG70_SYNKA|nr:hypothetical protein SKAU_G00037210 [Synaphobranchus kaupii]